MGAKKRFYTLRHFETVSPKGILVGVKKKFLRGGQKLSGIKTYTISQACKELGMASHKLRYIEEAIEYDVERDSFGNRQYTEADIANIREFMRLKEENSMSYIAVKKSFYDQVKNAPIDNTEVIQEVAVEEKSLSTPKDAIALHEFMARIERFQNSLDIVIEKLDKVDLLDEKLQKLENLDRLSKLDELDSLKEEVRGFLGESREIMEIANREAEQRVTNMTVDLKEALAIRKEQVNRSEQKGFFKKLFG